MQKLSNKKLSRLLYSTYYHHSDHPTNNLVVYDSKQAAQYISQNFAVVPLHTWEDAEQPDPPIDWEGKYKQTKRELQVAREARKAWEAEYVEGALAALKQEREENERLRAEVDELKGLADTTLQEWNNSLEYTNHRLEEYVAELEDALHAAQLLIDSYKEYQSIMRDTEELTKRLSMLAERRKNYENAIQMEDDHYFSAYLKVQSSLYAESDYEENVIDYSDGSEM